MRAALRRVINILCCLEYMAFFIMLNPSRLYCNIPYCNIPKRNICQGKHTSDRVRLITNKSLCAREIISAVYGRRRRTGAARSSGRAKEVAIRCRLPWEQVQGALVPPPCEPAFSRQGAVRGRASWPRLRRHLADKIGLPLPKDDRGAVLIKNPQDVRQSSVELYPEDSEVFRF